MKPKILFALNFRKLEEAIEKKLKGDFEFVGSASYREVIIDKISQTNPDIVIIREAIPGKKTLSDMIYTIRNTHKDARIIFMTGRRDPGDQLLSLLVSYGVYDIIASETIPMSSVVSLIEKPNNFDDVSHLLPRPSDFESKAENDRKVEPKTTVVKTPKAPKAPKNNNKTISTPKVGVGLIDNEEVLETEKTPIINKSRPVIMEEPEPEPIPVIEPEPKPVVEPEIVVEPEVELILESEPEPVVEPIPAPKKRQKQKNKTKPKQNYTFAPTSDSTPIQAPAVVQSQMPAHQTMIMQSKQIITFMGAVNGVGNTQMALNAAVKLAQDGLRVLLIELNPNFSTNDTTFQLGEYQKGLDKALEMLASQNQKDIRENIIQMQTIQSNTKSTNAMSRNYRKMPNTLDFLMFSQDYQTLVFKPEMDYSQLKDLCMLFLLQEGYDYVVIDSEPLGKNAMITQDLSSISSKVFVTLNQDTAQIGHVSRHVIELNKRINTEEKFYYILNKEVAGSFDRSMIEEWLDVKLAVVVEDAKNAFVESNFIGIPYVLQSKKTDTQQAFETLKMKIQQN